MDEFVENILRKWNLVDLVERFRDEEVNEEAFLFLTPEIIKELIPKLGRRAIFTGRYNEFKQTLQCNEEQMVSNARSSFSPLPTGPKEHQPMLRSSSPATIDVRRPASADNAQQFEKYFIEQLSSHPPVPTGSEPIATTAEPSTSESAYENSAKRIKLESFEVEDYGDSILLEDSSQDSESLLIESNHSMNKTMEDPLVPGVEKLRLLLQQSPFARYLLGLTDLDKFNRIDLTNVVVHYIFSNKQSDRMSIIFSYWADAIVALFPNEVKESYYSSKEGNTGRLQARYSYMLRVKKHESSRQPSHPGEGPSQSSSNPTECNDPPEKAPSFLHPAEMQVVEELRRIVSSCFVMRDTLHAKTLTANQRNILTANIVNYLMDKNGGPISLQELELYARAIEQIFPNENASIYFRRKGECARVNGKLFDRYGYMKRKRSLAQGKSYNDFLDSNTPIGKLWEMKTVDDARALWNETYKARKEVSKKVVPAKLFEQFPFLAQPDGYTLFLDDFDQDHPHAIDTFKRHWPEFATAIYRYIEENNFLTGVNEFETEGSSKTADNYTIVEIMEDAEAHLYSLPSKWVDKNGWIRDGSDAFLESAEGTDLCYWPSNAAGYRLLERAKNDPSITVVQNCLNACRCKIRKSCLVTFEEAYLEQQMMEMDNALENHDLHRELQNGSDLSDKPNTSDRKDTKEPDVLQAVNLVSRTANASVQVSLASTALQSTVDALQAKVNRISAEFEAFKAHVRAEFAALHQTRITSTPPQQVSHSSHTPSEATPMPPVPVVAAPIITNIQSPLIPVVPVHPVNRARPGNQPAEPPLVPVKNLEDLEALQEQARDERFVESVVHSLGIVHGQGRSVGNGWTVSLQTVDYFFDRRFLLRCSWTGSGRNKEKAGERISKIAFHKYDKVINLFYRVIVYSDPLFTYNDCMKFLHRCIRNAKARAADVKGMRLSVARNRKKRTARKGSFSQILPMDSNSQTEPPEEYYYQVESLVKDEYVDENVNQYDVL